MSEKKELKQEELKNLSGGVGRTTCFEDLTWIQSVGARVAIVTGRFSVKSAVVMKQGYYKEGFWYNSAIYLDCAADYSLSGWYNDNVNNNQYRTSGRVSGTVIEI